MFISYKRGVEPDEPLALQIRAALGQQLYLSSHQPWQIENGVAMLHTTLHAGHQLNCVLRSSALVPASAAADLEATRRFLQG